MPGESLCKHAGEERQGHAMSDEGVRAAAACFECGLSAYQHADSPVEVVFEFDGELDRVIINLTGDDIDPTLVPGSYR